MSVNDDDRFMDFFVRNRPRALVLFLLLLALIALTNVAGQPGW